MREFPSPHYGIRLMARPAEPMHKGTKGPGGGLQVAADCIRTKVGRIARGARLLQRRLQRVFRRASPARWESIRTSPGRCQQSHSMRWYLTNV